MITDVRINKKGELEAKVIPDPKWNIMYTYEEVVAMLDKVEKQIDFEQKWLSDVLKEEGNISMRNVDIAMSGIRHKLDELKGQE